MKKRSVSLHSHQTSIALEPEFWAVIDEHVKREGISLAGFIAAMDDARMDAGQGQGLASFLRVWCLEAVQGAIPVKL